MSVGTQASLPRLLAGITAQDAMTLSDHLQLHGPLPYSQRRERRQAAKLIELVEKAGLRGRGGAGFPTATKMRAVAGARGRGIVLINATEGEPASAKDRTMMEMLPQLVLDGGVLAADAIGADEVIVCVCESARGALESTRRAIRERRSQTNEPSIRLAPTPNTYLSGQESALVSHLNGGAALPTFTPPMVFERGVSRRPTFVSNAETLANVALIGRYKVDWFRELGTADEPGSRLVTLTGEVANTGVYEIEQGATLSSLVDAADGLTATVQAALIGGYGGTWVDGAALGDLRLCDEQLSTHGASLGAGVVVLLGERACGVAETVRISRWLAAQSAGQCGPCVHGLDGIAEVLEKLAQGRAEGNYVRRLAHLTALVTRRGACGHPDGAVRFIASALRVFATEFRSHAQRGPCRACAYSPTLPLSSVGQPQAALV